MSRGLLLPGLGIAAAVSLLLLAYPLWWQFKQGGSYHGQPFLPDEHAETGTAVAVEFRNRLVKLEQQVLKLTQELFGSDDDDMGVPG